MLKYLTILLFLTACGPNPYSFPLIIQLSPNNSQANQDIIKYINEFNTLMRCPKGDSVQLVTTDALWQIEYTTQSNLGQIFPEIAKDGGISDIQETYSSNAFTQSIAHEIIWFGTDCTVHECPSSDDIARVVLHWIGVVGGLGTQSNNPYLITYNHPSWISDPAAELVKELIDNGSKVCP